MQVKRFVLVAAVVMLGVACGAYQLPSGSNPSPSSGTGFDVTATNADHMVTMHVGQKLEVALRATAGMTDWSHPTSNDTSVLTPIVDPAAAAAIGVTLAAFQALKPGQVTVTSQGGPKCPSPGQACPMYVALYSLQVTVTP